MLGTCVQLLDSLGSSASKPMSGPVPGYKRGRIYSPFQLMFIKVTLPIHFELMKLLQSGHAGSDWLEGMHRFILVFWIRMGMNLLVEPYCLDLQQLDLLRLMCCWLCRQNRARTPPSDSNQGSQVHTLSVCNFL